MKSKKVLACEGSPENRLSNNKWFRLGENCPLRSLLCYMNNQHPIVKNDNCLFRRHPRTPASCDTVVWIQPWTRNEKIGLKWVQTWMFGRQTFEFCVGARQIWAHCYYWRIDRTGNCASKLSGIHVSDCLTGWSIWPDLCLHSEMFIASIRRQEEVM